MRDAGLEDTQAGLEMAGRDSDPLRYAEDTTLMAEREEELKSLLRKGKEESEHVGLKLNIQKTEIMACGPIISWEIDGNRWKQGQTLFGGGGAPESLQMVTVAMTFQDADSWEEKGRPT